MEMITSYCQGQKAKKPHESAGIIYEGSMCSRKIVCRAIQSQPISRYGDARKANFRPKQQSRFQTLRQCIPADETISTSYPMHFHIHVLSTANMCTLRMTVDQIIETDERLTLRRIVNNTNEEMLIAFQKSCAPSQFINQLDAQENRKTLESGTSNLTSRLVLAGENGEDTGNTEMYLTVSGLSFDHIARTINMLNVVCKKPVHV